MFLHLHLDGARALATTAACARSATPPGITTRPALPTAFSAAPAPSPSTAAPAPSVQARTAARAHLREVGGGRFGGGRPRGRRRVLGSRAGDHRGRAGGREAIELLRAESGVRWQVVEGEDTGVSEGKDTGPRAASSLSTTLLEPTSRPRATGRSRRFTRR